MVFNFLFKYYFVTLLFALDFENSLHYETKKKTQNYLYIETVGIQNFIGKLMFTFSIIFIYQNLILKLKLLVSEVSSCIHLPQYVKSH